MATVSFKEFMKGGTPTVVTAPKETETKQPGFLENTGDDIFGEKGVFKSGARDVISDVTKAKDTFKTDPLAATKLLSNLGGDVAKVAAETVAAPITEGAKELLPEDIKSNLHSFVGKVVTSPEFQSLSKAAKDHPEIARQLQNLFDVGTLGVGEATAEKVAKTASETVAKTAEAAAPTVESTGRLLKSVGEDVYKSAITPTVKEGERILNYEAKAPFFQRIRSAVTGSPIYDEVGKVVSAPVTRSTTALKEGLYGTQRMIGVQAKKAADSLYRDVIAPAVKASKEVVTKEDLFEPILDRISKTIEPGKKQAFQDAFDAIKQEYKSIENFTLEDAQNVKRTLDQFTPEKVFRGKSIADEYRTLQNDMANAIREKTYQALSDVNIKRSYLDYGNLSELQKIGIKAITEGGTKGGFGSFWSSMWDAATTPVKTIGGKVLYRVGNKLEFVGDKGTKTLGDYLRTKGYRPPKM